MYDSHDIWQWQVRQNTAIICHKRHTNMICLSHYYFMAGDVCLVSTANSRLLLNWRVVTVLLTRRTRCRYCSFVANLPNTWRGSRSKTFRPRSWTNHICDNSGNIGWTADEQSTLSPVWDTMPVAELITSTHLQKPQQCAHLPTYNYFKPIYHTTIFR